MIQFIYLACLIVSILGLVAIDYRYKLALSVQPRRTLKTLGITVAIFVVWDLLGIALGIFSHGNSQYSLPLRLLPEFPLEELFFLLLLTYFSLLIYRKVSKI